MREANADSEAIAHHFTQAGLDDVAIEWWGKAGDEALRRSAFQEAISHLGKAIEMADKAATALQINAKRSTIASHRLKLQTAYGQAMMWSKGFATEETNAALARAAELAATSSDFSERFTAAHGQFALVVMRGELRLASELASRLLAHAEDLNRIVEVGVARRGLGFVCYFAGHFDKAQDHFKRAIDATSPEGEQEARERYGEYTGTLAQSHLGLTKWQLGEVDRARELIDLANWSAAELAHVPSITTPIYAKSHLAILRGDAAAAMNAAEALRVLGREHGMALQLIYAEMNLAWAAVASTVPRQALKNLNIGSAPTAN